MSPHSRDFRPTTLSRSVSYHDDPSAIFAALVDDDTLDVALLESVDITTKSGLNSIALLQSSVRITCNSDEVVVEPLSPSGEVITQRLESQLADYRTSAGRFSFPALIAEDERERLMAVSSIEVLRKLTREAGYCGDELPLLVGGMAFDYLATFETLPPVEESANTFPDYQFALAEIVLSINHQTGEAHLSGIDATGDDKGLQERLDRLASRIDDTIRGLTGQEADVREENVEKRRTLDVNVDISDAEFCSTVETLKEGIYQGDIYQVVPARTFTARCEDAYSAYRHLRRSNPSPYMFYVRGVDRQGATYELFGASPESNLKFDPATRTTELYPIAGTRKRGLNPDGSINHELDVRMELELRTDRKEIAEHTMLVDLARNDLARVATPGTRQVADLLQVDRYSRVMHLVSRVTARLVDGLDALDAYRACMNMGTLTGAPKLRATEMLRRAEGRRRGTYGGSIGYLRGDGTMDNCIVIRSAYVTNSVAAVQAGAGVVKDSNPQAEADETFYKAYAVLHAIAQAANADLEVHR